MKSVSILIPCRNEERFIAKVLNNVLEQDYSEITEIFIMDGRSEDRTRDIIREYNEKDQRIRLLDNDYGIVPTAMNKGIEESTGDIVVRLDAHSEYPKSYVSRLVEVLEKEDADNTGGVWDTQPGDSGYWPMVYAAVQTSPFGIGDAQYRLGSKEVKEVDTVPYGCYRREVFDKIGVYDEELVRNQDDELNARLRNAGGKILLVPDVVITYYARSTWFKLVKMFYQYGLYKPLVALKVKKPATIRQFVPLGFLLATLALIVGGLMWTPVFWGLAGLYALYLAGALVFATRQAARYNNWSLVLVLPFCFWSIHMAYGLGYLLGIVNFIILGRRHQLSPIEIADR